MSLEAVVIASVVQHLHSKSFSQAHNLVTVLAALDLVRMRFYQTVENLLHNLLENLQFSADRMNGFPRAVLKSLMNPLI
jgi:hypothetical protein